MTEVETKIRAACLAALDAALVGADPVLKAAVLVVAPTVPATDPDTYVADVNAATVRVFDVLIAAQRETLDALDDVTGRIDALVHRAALHAMVERMNAMIH